mmetsp:Transcript_55177/g.170877  ORF Transcript_55177/g.170877 Transcript_55177/m.170877 type:complete len:246 (+) Transcript_55177:104-841(+)
MAKSEDLSTDWQKSAGDFSCTVCRRKRLPASEFSKKQVEKALESLKSIPDKDIRTGPDIQQTLYLSGVCKKCSEEREERERRERQRAAEERRQREEAEREAVQARLSEEEQLRLEVLAELERSQMPAVQQEDGLLLKTIEHYTFADTMEVATISIDLDKDLFEGAAAHVTEANVEVTTRDSEVTILLHGVPASKTVAALADWRLHLAPLFHTVDEEGTSWKVRKGKVSVRLRKRKQQEWRRVLKF